MLAAMLHDNRNQYLVPYYLLILYASFEDDTIITLVRIRSNKPYFGHGMGVVHSAMSDTHAISTL